VLLAPTRTPFFPTIRRRAALARFARQLGNAYSLRLAVTAARQPEESLADTFRRLATQGATGDGTSSEDWARWIDGSLSLVDSFEKDGRRYVVAMRSVPEAGDPRVLTAMERTVAGYAAHGYSNQLIAQTLGLGPSTIAGLLQRIVQKLGLAHRSQLPLLAATTRLAPPDAAD
jgi:DNA-binding CsgD family transcriptional regulator